MADCCLNPKKERSMKKFIVYIDLSMEEIVRGYRNYFGKAEGVSKKDIAVWIGNLAQSDIEALANNDEG